MMRIIKSSPFCMVAADTKSPTHTAYYQQEKSPRKENWGKFYDKRKRNKFSRKPRKLAQVAFPHLLRQPIKIKASISQHRKGQEERGMGQQKHMLQVHALVCQVRNNNSTFFSYSYLHSQRGQSLKMKKARQSSLNLLLLGIAGYQWDGEIGART